MRALPIIWKRTRSSQELVCRRLNGAAIAGENRLPASGCGVEGAGEEVVDDDLVRVRVQLIDHARNNM